jgi:GT2 family glycosyltransferase
VTPPLVTIITPAYNRADLIAETIDSVLAQDYPRIEYIVIDDGSKDDTLSVINRYDGRLRWETQANSGEAATVNRGLALATGEIVGIVNSDDPLLPGAVRRLVEALAARPDAVVAYPDWQVIDEHGRVLETFATPEFPGAVENIRLHLCVPGPAAFFRRSLVERIGGRDPELRYVGDMEFWFRACLVGEFVRVPEVLATFRVHSGSASVRDTGERMAAEHLRAVEKLFRHPDLPAEIRSAEAEALSSAHYVAGTSCGGRLTKHKLAHFTQALRLAPRQYFAEQPTRLLMIAASCAGVSQMDARIWWQRGRGFWQRFRRAS